VCNAKDNGKSFVVTSRAQRRNGFSLQKDILPSQTQVDIDCFLHYRESLMVAFHLTKRNIRKPLDEWILYARF